MNRLPTAKPDWPEASIQAHQCFERHLSAILHPHGFEVGIVLGMDAWLSYADAYRNRYEDSIGSDYVLGDYWLTWGKALRGMLNGDCGRLDCGTLDSAILDAIKAAGFNPDEVL